MQWMKLELLLLCLEKNYWIDSINDLNLELCMNMFKIMTSKHTNKIYKIGNKLMEIINCKEIM